YRVKTGLLSGKRNTQELRRIGSGGGSGGGEAQNANDCANPAKHPDSRKEKAAKRNISGRPTTSHAAPLTLSNHSGSNRSAQARAATAKPYTTMKPPYWDEATTSLAARDHILRRLIGEFPDIHLVRRGDAFTTLARAI